MKNIAKMSSFQQINFQNYEPSPKRHSKLNWSSNTQLAEFRTEEHHEERAGTNTL